MIVLLLSKRAPFSQDILPYPEFTYVMQHARYLDLILFLVRKAESFCDSNGYFRDA